jgi:hypothetical protein
MSTKYTSTPISGAEANDGHRRTEDFSGGLTFALNALDHPHILSSSIMTTKTTFGINELLSAEREAQVLITQARKGA